MQKNDNTKKNINAKQCTLLTNFSISMGSVTHSDGYFVFFQSINGFFISGYRYC